MVSSTYFHIHALFTTKSLIIMRNNHGPNFVPSGTPEGTAPYSEMQLCVLCNERPCHKKKLSKSKSHSMLEIYHNVIHFLPLTRESDKVAMTIHRCSNDNLPLACYIMGQIPLGHAYPKNEMLCQMLQTSPRHLENKKLYGNCQSFGSILALSKMNNKHYY